MTKETEILIPKEYEVKIGDRTYQIKRLGITSTIRLTRFVKNAISENAEKIAKLKAGSTGDMSDFDDIMNVIEAIGDEPAYKLFSMMIGEDDDKYLNGDNFGIGEMTNILKIFLTLNDIASVKKNVMEITKVIAPMMKLA